MKKIEDKKIIVSLTSHPKRINVIEPAFESIFKQTVLPDKIILWLAESEFINKEDDLPEYLLNLIRNKKIYIEWCPDIKSHKKIFYALKKYKDDIIITVDDDLIYHKRMIESLLKSYRKFPYAISAMRTHRMQKNDNETFVPYDKFVYEQRQIIEKPSMQLLATTGAGTLYPPNIFGMDYFDENIICDLCIHSDDLYMKIIEVIFDIPVVQIKLFKKLRYIQNTQDFALYKINSNGGNDKVLNNLIEWTDNLFEKNYILNKVFNTQEQNLEQNKKTILYFIPHQDDELFTMGIDINNSIRLGFDVHVILCTDGSATQVRNILNNKECCEYHKERHSYNLSMVDLIKARDKEFIESCQALGVKISNIHIPHERIADKNLNIKCAEKIIKRYLSIYGKDVRVCTTYFKNSKNQHSDHKNLGRAAYNLYKKGLINEIRFFREPYSKSKKKFKQISAVSDIVSNINKAISSYSYWNPQEGRYAIGLHSMNKEWDNFKNNMNNYYFDKKRILLPTLLKFLNFK